MSKCTAVHEGFRISVLAKLVNYNQILGYVADRNLYQEIEDSSFFRFIKMDQ